jgi:hypothetical protein
MESTAPNFKVCQHLKRKFNCKICTPSSVCIHEKRKYSCIKCNRETCLRNKIGIRTRSAIRDITDSQALDLVGLDILNYTSYIESTFAPGMSWDNYGIAWEIDHIRPLKAGHLSYFDLMNRLHFSNTRACWISENRKKSKKELDIYYESVFDDE